MKTIKRIEDGRTGMSLKDEMATLARGRTEMHIRDRVYKRIAENQGEREKVKAGIGTLGVKASKSILIAC